MRNYRNNNSMAVLITGANGFIGRAVVKKMVTEGHLVTACVRRNSQSVGLASEHSRLCEIEGLSSTADWTLPLADAKFVIHCAAQVSVLRRSAGIEDYRATNVEGTVCLARQAIAAGVRRFIFLSSLKVNGSKTTENRSYSAADIPCPSDAYSQSKFEAEQELIKIVQQSSMELTVVRPPLVYGPGVKANFAALIKAIKRGIPLPFGSVRQNQRSMISTANLADFLSHVMLHPSAANKTFLVSDDYDLSTTELLEKIAAAMGVKPRLLPIPVNFLIAAAKLFNKDAEMERITSSLTADITQTKQLLNWRPPITVEEGIQDAVHDHLIGK
jgi:nucleoside-diphosphate-sugar epimerase